MISAPEPSSLRLTCMGTPSVSKKEEREFWNCLPDPSQTVIRTMNFPGNTKRARWLSQALGRQQRVRRPAQTHTVVSTVPVHPLLSSYECQPLYIRGLQSPHQFYEAIDSESVEKVKERAQVETLIIRQASRKKCGKKHQERQTCPFLSMP